MPGEVDYRVAVRVCKKEWECRIPYRSLISLSFWLPLKLGMEEKKNE
jgi:hypothetical protein